jgi:hypothetical protein
MRLPSSAPPPFFSRLIAVLGLALAFAAAPALAPSSATYAQQQQGRMDEDTMNNDGAEADTSALDPAQLEAMLPAEFGRYMIEGSRSGVQRGEPGAVAVYTSATDTLAVTLAGLNATTYGEAMRAMEQMATSARTDMVESKLQGYKSFEGTAQGQRQLFVFVGDQMLVKAVTPGDAAMRDLRAAVEAVPLASLEEVTADAASMEDNEMEDDEMDEGMSESEEDGSRR